MKMLFIIIKEAGYYDRSALPIPNKNTTTILIETFSSTAKAELSSSLVRRS